MQGDCRIMLSGASVAARRAGAKNKQFYHDRCIAATPSNFLLQESKYGLAGAKSPCYSRLEVGIFSAYKKPAVKAANNTCKSENERATLNNSRLKNEIDATS